MPPMPVTNTTPPRSDGISGRPASSQASLAEAIAYWTNRSVLRISFGSIQAAGSKSRTSPASLTGRSDASNRSIGAMPWRPEVSPAQNSSTPVPTGVTGPMPVTTTRSPMMSLGHPQLRGDERDGLPDGLHALHLLLGDLDVPLILEGQHGLDEVEGVCVQVLGEPSVRDDLGLVHSELLGQDLADPGLDLCLAHPSSCFPGCFPGRRAGPC